jgi:hypothetical protein
VEFLARFLKVSYKKCVVFPSKTTAMAGLLLLVSGTAALTVSEQSTARQESVSVTFHKDVLPILQKHCQTCHRPEQIAPMSLLTYAETRPWAKAIKEAVVTRKMPPWFADPQHGRFKNDVSLRTADIETIARWVDGGAAEGDPTDAPAQVFRRSNEWEIPPDVIVNGPAFQVPASAKNNVIEWTYTTVPGGFKEDTWVTSMEIRPSQPAVTHHICVYFRPHTPEVMYNFPRSLNQPRDETGNILPAAAGVGRRPVSITAGSNGIEGCYVPGRASEDYRPYNAGKLIRAGTDIVFQVHYTPNGTAVTDRPRIGFTVSRRPPERRYATLQIAAPSDPKIFAIPPNDGNWESPVAEATFRMDADLVWMSPHMHLRGKDMTYQLVHPGGKTETILSVPRYDSNWQLGYELTEPLKVLKGTDLVVTAHFDNSIRNKFNPDSNRTVYYGEMVWEEMMHAFFSVVVPRDTDPRTIVGPRGTSCGVPC